MTETTNTKIILDDIATRVSNSTAAVVESFIQARVDRTIGERAELLEKAFQKLTEARIDVRKAEKQEPFYTATGEKTFPGYTKEQWDAVLKARAFVEKLEKAIEEALTGSWDPLKVVLK